MHLGCGTRPSGRAQTSYQPFGDTELADGVLFSTVFRVYFSEKVTLPSMGRSGAVASV